MARNDVLIRARPAEVFDVLTDPSSYGFWVVGTKRVRGHDRSWPKPGSRFHHTVGIGPARLRDDSEVLEIERDRRLVLEARTRPFGTATVELELVPRKRGKATKVTMREVARSGPLRVVWNRWNPMFDIAVHLRNVVALRRLKRLAEARADD
jgi:uncharacterized protein YndB with AHSA1/START domain